MNIPTTRQLVDLSGKKFLVIGGARTLGHDMATALAEFGAEGIVTSRNEASAVTAAQKISAATGSTIHGLALDAGDESAVRAGIASAIATLGRIDILINNVGGGIKAEPRLEIRPLEAWEAVQRVNVTAPFLVCKHVAPGMIAQRSGSIINIASIAGLIGRDRRVYPAEMPAQSIDYAAAKGAIIAMTRDLAAYLGPHGVRANVISPGGFERGQPPAFIHAYSDKTPLRRMGRDGVDLKGAAVFLASEAAAFVTGHNLVVDGGFSTWQ